MQFSLEAFVPPEFRWPHRWTTLVLVTATQLVMHIRPTRSSFAACGRHPPTVEIYFSDAASAAAMSIITDLVKSDIRR
jgi:hypothetical protein